MRRLGSLTLIAGLLLALPLVARGADVFPDQIDLPDGWRPEGIATTPGVTFYVGSVGSGAVFRGDLRTGEGSVLVQPQADRRATGLEVDQYGRLFVSGAATGKAFVYDAATGDDIATYDLATAPTFINDVVVTQDAVWFTDSMKPVLYRIPVGPGGALGAAEIVELRGDFEFVPGAFNVNGIDATPDGKTLILVQSTPGRLFTADPTGLTQAIELGGASMSNGDGILLDGKTLYVVRNQLNQIAVVQLAANLGSGEVVDTLTDPGLDVPTTIAEHGDRLYAVNARFSTPPTPTTAYWVTKLPK